MKYLHKYNEKLTSDEVASCLIELIDMGYEFSVRKNEPYNSSNIVLKKFIYGTYTKNQVFRCIVNRDNIGCDRNIIGWRNSKEVELNDDEKLSINASINASEKLLLVEDSIKQIRIEAEYYDVMDQQTYELLNCYYITLYISK